MPPAPSPTKPAREVDSCQNVPTAPSPRTHPSSGRELTFLNLHGVACTHAPTMRAPRPCGVPGVRVLQGRSISDGRRFDLRGANGEPLRGAARSVPPASRRGSHALRGEHRLHVRPRRHRPGRLRADHEPGERRKAPSALPRGGQALWARPALRPVPLPRRLPERDLHPAERHAGRRATPPTHALSTVALSRQCQVPEVGTGIAFRVLSS